MPASQKLIDELTEKYRVDDLLAAAYWMLNTEGHDIEGDMCHCPTDECDNMLDDGKKIADMMEEIQRFCLERYGVDVSKVI